MVNFAYGRFEQIQSSAAAVNTVITLLALLISIVVSIALIISITRPINAALQFGKLVGGGDFSARWNNTGKDELSQLASVLNTAFDKVADKVVGLKIFSTLCPTLFLLPTTI
jgi:Signal transduction histidine kinase, nitrate/nitrite-specific